MPKIYNFVTLDNLHDPKRFEFQIDKMFNKIKDTKGIGALFDSHQDGVPFFSFGYDRRELAKTLAASIKNETFRYSPMQQKQMKMRNKNKVRIIYHACPIDKIVLGALSKLLIEILKPFLNSAVYSYRKGVSSKNEVIALGNYIKEQRELTKKKGVYLVQSDISAYSDNINVQDSSPFWENLIEYFVELKINPTEYQWYLIKEAIRPNYYSVEGNLQVNLKGAPTGSPITTMLYNFYLASADFYHMIEPSPFFARYSDDIIICHTEPDIVEGMEDYFFFYLKTMSLTLSEKKTRRYYFSPAGNNAKDPKWKGSNRIDLLGFSLNAYGNITLSTSRQKKFLRKIYYGIKNTLKILAGYPKENVGPMLCKVVNNLLTDENTGRNTLVHLMQSSDMVQLKQMDYRIALMMSEALTGKCGVRAFRKYPYQKLRQEWGLVSLVDLRNKELTG